MPDAAAPLGVFDSGIGGLSVLRALLAQLPREPIIYLADQGRVPYGPRPILEVRHFTEQLTRRLIERGVKAIVVACNTASAAGLRHIRAVFPAMPIIGMEPAVKPAAEHTRTGIVGVLATPATFQGELYASVVERFAQDVSLLQHAPLGLVEQIEKGNFRGAETRRLLEAALLPMLAQGIDTIVLGCTHYPFVIPLIEDICGPGVRVIDPSPAIARQTAKILAEHSLLTPAAGAPPLEFLTTGDPACMQAQIKTLLGLDAAPRRETLPP
jgi:glutamate racemase